MTIQRGWLVWCTGAVCVAVGFIMAISSLTDTSPPIRILGSQREVTSTSDGHSFTVRREACVLRVVPGRTSHSLAQVNGPLQIQLGESETRLALGCHVIEPLTIIPPEIPRGDYWYEVTTRYQTSPVNTVTINWPPVLVHILE